MRTVISSATHKGARDYQEDRFVVDVNSDGVLAAVYDGHGGDKCSAFLKTATLDAFNAVADNPALPVIGMKLKGMFEWLAVRTKEFESGSTGTIAYIPPALDKVYVGVLGDSPAIVKLADGQFWIAPDHNVRSNPREAELARARGCTIYGGYMYAPEKHFGDLAQGLQMSRAFGDADMNSALLREPEVFELPIGKDSFVLVGTDGLFDPSHRSSESAKEIAALADIATNEAKNLVNYSVQKPTNDNVTAILVRITE